MTGKDILIVEDENIVALDMRMRLETMGYRVADVVDTGNLALERARELSPDLVLMDIKLKGGQDGIEAARLLRERAEVPVIFVTAFTDEKTLERAKQTSPYGYIVKPFHERELRIAIELALYKHQYELSMRRSKELAEAANRLKGEFLANISHELKTPLNSMIGFTELSMEKAFDSEQREYLAMSLAAARSLQTLIDSILDFTRMEAGKFTAVASPFSLDAVLSDCADALALGAYSKGLAASFRRSPGMPDALIGDHFLLKQTLLNLVDNAVKFTDSGRVRLLVTSPASSVDENQKRVFEFEVSDTGIGMPPGRIEDAFQRFTQLDSTKTRKAGGTGLGLAIVKKAVELLGGTINVESREHEGTRICLRVPFAVQEEDSPRLQSVLAGGRIALVGFEGEGYEDAAAAVEGLGATAVKVPSLAAASETGQWTLVEEEEAERASETELASLLPRLIIATRIGGNARQRLGRLTGCAFTPQPLRDYRIAEAAKSLLSSTPHRPAAASTEESVPDYAAAMPGEENMSDTEKTGTSAGIEGGGNDRTPPETSVDAAVSRQRALLERLANVLEAASAHGSFTAAEREVKSVKDAFAESGDRNGARIAFAALLLARKGDAEGLREVASKARSASRSQGKGRKEEP
jgi:signal transduction histidine kinase